MTRSKKFASFIEHHSFVSCIEPTSVEEALKDPDWVNAMHEKLNNFTRNQVWTLEEQPQDARVIEIKWVFHNKQDDQGVVVSKKQYYLQKGSLKLKVWILERPLHRLQDLKPFVSSLHMHLIMK